MNNRDILIWLNNIKGVSNNTINILEEHFGQLSVIWEVSNKDIYAIKSIRSDIKQAIISSRNDSYYEKIVKKIENQKIKVLTILDENYPEKLIHIYQPPKVLYLKGSVLEKDNISLSIVGSRKATCYGKWVSEKIAKELSELGITIVSGMANGIDSMAHIGAIKGRGRTLAVLGSGVDVIYPKKNKKLYKDIINNGAVLSEYPVGCKPLRQNFPVRNRIISGLSLGVLVVEATEKSGSLITTNHALEQGRDVFAIPGNINSIYSKGTNKLIKDGAKIVTSIDDIIEEIVLLKDIYKNNEKKEMNYDNLNVVEMKVVKCINNGPIHCDMISYNTGINISELNSILTILEMKGIIKQLKGNVFTIN